MSDDVVLDSSALLAFLLGERGGEQLLLLLERSVMSAVNLAEVRSKLIDLGPLAEMSGKIAFGVMRRIEPFTEEDAIKTAELRSATRAKGLSLGDRACLALAIELGADVYTADRLWGGLDLGCTIHLLR